MGEGDDGKGEVCEEKPPLDGVLMELDGLKNAVGKASGGTTLTGRGRYPSAGREDDDVDGEGKTSGNSGLGEECDPSARDTSDAADGLSEKNRLQR